MSRYGTYSVRKTYAVVKTLMLTNVQKTIVWDVVNNPNQCRKMRNDTGNSEIISKVNAAIIPRIKYRIYEDNCVPTLKAFYEDFVRDE